MLKTFRERTKTILWIVVLAFVISIFALWGMDLRTPDRHEDDAELAGVVNGEKISHSLYQNSLNQLWTQMKEQQGEGYEPSEVERDLLANQAWELAIQNRLMAKEIVDLGIKVSDEELVAFLRRNPHPQLVKAYTTEDGAFDYQAYLRALADPDADWRELERWGRAAIPEIILQTYLISQVHVPEADLLKRFEERNTAMRAQYVEIPLGAAPGGDEPAEAELRSLYESKIKDFTEPAMRRIRAIEIEKRPSAADEEDAAERLADLRGDIMSGRIDFAKAAEEYSDDDATAGGGGDLGFFKRGEKDPEFDRVAFSLRPGEMSDPFKSAEGYHLVKVEERKSVQGAVETRARHILIRVEIGTETIDSLSAYIRQTTEAIREDGFERAAADLELAIREFEPFPQGMFVKQLGLAPRIVSFAFSHRTGAVSYPIETASSIYIVKVVEEIPERVRPFEEMRERLLADARNALAEADARSRADAARAAIVANGFEKGAKAHGLAVKTTPLFKQSDQIPGIGANTTFSAACMMLPENAVSPPIKGERRYYVIKVVERSEPDIAAYGEARQKLLEEASSEAVSRFIANWYQKIREKAKVEDLRERKLR